MDVGQVAHVGEAEAQIQMPVHGILDASASKCVHNRMIAHVGLLRENNEDVGAKVDDVESNEAMT